MVLFIQPSYGFMFRFVFHRHFYPSKEECDVRMNMAAWLFGSSGVLNFKTMVSPWHIEL